MRQALTILGILVVAGVIAWALAIHFRSNSSVQTGRSGAQPETSTVVPRNVTATTAPPIQKAAPVQSQNPLGPEVASYVRQRTGVVTAAVEDLKTGQTWLLHPGDPQATASIVKVDVMATLLSESTAKAEPLTATDQTLLLNMIEYSDNTAATTLWNTVGGPSAIKSFDLQVGMTDTTPSLCLTCAGFPWPGWGLTTTTAADQLALLRTIVLPNTLLSNAQRAYALQLMQAVTPSERWGISEGLSSGTVVALKNGWVPLGPNDWQIDSVGWVHGAGRNYLIAVLTTMNPTEDYGIQTIDQISGMVFRVIDQ